MANRQIRDEDSLKEWMSEINVFATEKARKILEEFDPVEAANWDRIGKLDHNAKNQYQLNQAAMLKRAEMLLDLIRRHQPRLLLGTENAD